MKCCGKCGQQKPYGSFYRRTEAADGLRSNCKSCHENRRAELLSDPERAAKHRAQHILASRQYAERHRLAHRDDPEYRAYRKEANRRRYVRHHDRMLAQMRAAYAAAPERQRLSARIWQQRNPDRRKIHKATRRALKIRSGGRFTVAEWTAMLSFYEGHCLRCGATDDICHDHVVPLSKGGRNSIENIQPLCRRCNSIKATAIMDYRTEIKR